MRVLVIDPGTYESGWVIIETNLGIKGPPGNHGKYRNEELAELLETTTTIKLVVMEKLEARGMASQQVIDTAEWVGEFRRICRQRDIEYCDSHTRNDVKLILGGICTANDAQIRDIVARHWGVQVIKNRLTGILKGYVKDEIQALGLALAWMRHTGVK